jgi:integrase
VPSNLLELGRIVSRAFDEEAKGMPRPRNDGTPAAPANRRKLTDRFVRSITPEIGRVVHWWDSAAPGLFVATHETGRQSWRVGYRVDGRPVGLKIGDARSIPLADARKLAARVAFQVAEGRDPGRERRAERAADTFAALAERYVREWASKRNKSWRQADAIIKRSLLPRWGRLKARAITRADVRALLGRIEAPAAANATLATASAVFSFAVRMEIVDHNPCLGVERNPARSRERTLSDDEIRLLWDDLDVPFRLVLLSGARPGEIFSLRAEDVVDGVWTQPGAPTGSWPGTKNARTHLVQLSEMAAALVDEHLARRLNRRGCEDRLKKLWRRRAIEMVRPHDLRRTFGTLVTRLGFPSKRDGSTAQPRRQQRRIDLRSTPLFARGRGDLRRGRAPRHRDRRRDNRDRKRH